VRVNKKRVDQTYRLQLGDILRIPPIRVAEKPESEYVPATEFPILYEDEALLAINKPAGNGGAWRQRGEFRGDRTTAPVRGRRPNSWNWCTGWIARLPGSCWWRRGASALTGMHEIMREGNSDKRYFTLVLGQWKNAKQHVKLPLHKFDTPQGEKRVMVREDGQASHTIFTLQKSWPDFTLLEAQASKPDVRTRFAYTCLTWAFPLRATTNMAISHATRS